MLVSEPVQHVNALNRADSRRHVHRRERFYTDDRILYSLNQPVLGWMDRCYVQIPEGGESGFGGGGEDGSIPDHLPVRPDVRFAVFAVSPGVGASDASWRGSRP
jgi:hypothetical protein